jgi:hypothetical protein
VTTVIFGSNRFVDCTTLVAFRGIPLLSVLSSPLRVNLATPTSSPSKFIVDVVANVANARSSPGVRVIKNEGSVAIFLAEAPLVIATLLSAEEVSLRADLRPVGIRLYDDATGLSIGSMHFARSTFSSAQVAVNLG